jgi:hypothetical protein
MKLFWLTFFAFLTGLLISEQARAGTNQSIPIVVDAPLVGPAAQALADLERAWQGKGYTTTRMQTMPDKGMAVVVGSPGSAVVDRLLKAHGILLSKAAESLCIKKLVNDKQTTLLITGREPRGLSYALLDAARAIELAPQKVTDPFAAISEAVEEPFLRVRSITLHLFNADLEKEWYFNEQYWKDYFTMLARYRYNNLTLTFTDQTNYLNPIYAYLLDVPGFPQVRIKGLTEADRRRNLAMLKRITELAHERGLDFTLGIWMQLPIPRYAGQVLVENLPNGLAAADYCAAGLKHLLQACPGIDAVQLRMNDEAGIPEEQQAEFFGKLFQAIRDCGRAVRVELRYKGLRPETIRAALEMGLDVTVSTKFWAEHMGLPYHPTVVDSHYRASRYSFGSMLVHPRKYHVIYRLWSVGTQRLLLWGDPDYAARFARSCQLGGGEGFEVFAPLSNKGFGNLPGSWRLFADKGLEHFRWEHERYWFFYLAFGRLAYNPQADPEIWRRELRHRFGKAAEAMEAAYRQASQVLPLLTATRLPSASEWSWWPEMDTGDRLPEYMHTPPSDTAQFYAIRTWKPTPRWRCEKWDEDNPGYVEDAVVGRLRGKWTPLQISSRLRDLAGKTQKALDQARSQVPDPMAGEFRATELDLRVLAALAQYHAGNTLAATELAFFELTAEAARLPRALEHKRAAVASWERVVRLTEGAYHSNLIFGHSPLHNRPHGHHHSGHWKDRLTEVREDLTLLEMLLKKHGSTGKTPRIYPGEANTPEKPMLDHTPVKEADPGKDLTLSVRVPSQAPLKKLVVHFRPLNQTMSWKSLPMKQVRPGQFTATVSSKDITRPWDWQYYFEALLEGGGGFQWPSWEQGPPYFVVKVIGPGF